MRSSVVTNLTLWFGISAFTIISVCTGYLYWSLSNTLRYQSAHLLMDKLKALRTLTVDVGFEAKEIFTRIEREWTAGEFEDVYVRILDDKGTVITETPGMAPQILDILNSAKIIHDGNISLERLVKEDPNNGFLSQAEWMPVRSGGTTGFLVAVALDCAYEERVLVGYRNQIYFAIPLAFLLCGFVGWSFARKGVRPISEIACSTAKIKVTNLGERISLKNLPVELGVLARNFNLMLDRLEDSFGRLSRFSADISHELRTPLNNMRGELEVTLSKDRSREEYQDALGSCLEECGKIGRIIDSLIFLAQSENPSHHLITEPANLKLELSRVLDFYEAAASEMGVQTELEVDDSITVQIERTLFQRAMGNLLANAIRHTPPGGLVKFKVATEGDFARIHVKDTGCGIPAKHIPFIFDRFYRVDRSRSKQSGGCGLGLAIVHSIATIHGGEVNLSSSVGKGTDVNISFPRV